MCADVYTGQEPEHRLSSLPIFHKISQNADSNLTNNTFGVVDVEMALGKLKTGKSPGVEGIVKEHLLYSHPSIIAVSYTHLTLPTILRV